MPEENIENKHSFKQSKIMDAINCSLESNFTQIPNDILRTPNLSFKAKGLLCLLLSNSDGWVSHKSAIANMGLDGLDSIQSGLNELKKHGYFWPVKYVDKTTKRNRGSFWAYTKDPWNFSLKRNLEWLEFNNFEIWSGSLKALQTHYNDWKKSQKPEAEKPKVDFPYMAFPVMENPSLIIPILNNTNFQENQEKTIGEVASQPSPNELKNNPSLDDSNKTKPSKQNPPNKTLQRKAQKVLINLNKIGSKPRGFRPTETHLKNIIARLKEGFSVQDCLQVLVTKIQDPYFKENPQYYNPDTLFRPKNFEKYLNEDPRQYKKQNKGPSNGSGLSGMKYDKPNRVPWMDIGVDLTSDPEPNKGKFTPQWMLDQEAEEARNKKLENEE